MRKVRDNLWIGDCLDAKNHHEQFDTIISMVRIDDYDSGNADYRFPIADGSHDHYTFGQAVRQARQAYDAGDKLLVHCQAGVSRSTAVVTAMLAVKEGKNWEEVLYDTRAGHAPVSPELVASGKRYIETCKRHDG
ncbi:dual specificity phosphatase [Halogranum tailed virus 1]|uniref:protein-tyrosine-phosphatase n=1 Tax=Halogranum tailed virus 1 TaxID=1273749 RepID=R4TGT8_9CAUD|nr:dual specificity phosphatase [Halogranum tailed virus 1]AGM11476.1 Ser/Thr and Tyr protein phosphatase [Halogranum tailed virus 1]